MRNAIRLCLAAAGIFFAIGLTSASACTQHGSPCGAEPNAVASPFVATFGGQTLSEAKRFIGSANPTGRIGPWCAWFVSFVLERTGHRPLKDGRASSALAYGPHTSNPQPGDLVVMRGHVGFYAGRSADGNVLLTSGNWNRRVADGEISPRQVVAYVQVL